jgi:excisionase family DNA binding protein
VQLTATLPAADIEALVDFVTARALRRLEVSAVSPWMNVTSAAAYLDWPPKRLYNLVSKGEIPHRKHAGRLLFNRKELDRWLNEQYQGPEEFRP